MSTILRCCHFTQVTASDPNSGVRCKETNDKIRGRKCLIHDFWVCGHHIDFSPVCGDPKCARKIEIPPFEGFDRKEPPF